MDPNLHRHRLRQGEVPLDEYDTLTGLQAVGRFLVTSGLLLAFLVALWMFWGVWSHWTEVERTCYRKLEPEYASKQRLIRHFCDVNPTTDGLSTTCLEARDFLQVGIAHRVFDMVVQTHLDHLPFVAHCRNTSDCRSFIFGLHEALKSSLWWVCIILSGGVAIALVVGVKATLVRCCRVNRERRIRQPLGLPAACHKKCE